MSGIKYSYMNYRVASGLIGVQLDFGDGEADTAVFRFLGKTTEAMNPFNIDQALDKWINWGKPDDTHRNLGSAIQQVIWSLDTEGKTDRALSYLLRMLPFSTDYIEQSFLCLDIGGYLKKVSRYNDAVACFRECLEKWPADPQMQYMLHNNMGYCLCMMDQSVEAEKCCREAIGLIPDEYHAHKNLAATLLGQLRFAEAAACLLQALEVAPGNDGALKVVELFLATFPQLPTAAPEVVGRIRELLKQANPAAQDVKATETAGAV